MNKENFMNTMNFLCIAYNKELTSDIIKLWYNFFKDYDEQVFKDAIYQIISVEKFFPSIAMVKETIAKQNNSTISLSGEAEWEEIINVVRIYGRYQEEEAMNKLKPQTRNVLKRIGYQEICNADENRKYNLRSAFLKAFENEKNDVLTYTMLDDGKLNDSKQLENIKNRVEVGNAISMMANKKRISGYIEED